MENPFAELVSHLHLKAAIKAPVDAAKAVETAGSAVGGAVKDVASGVSTVASAATSVISFMEALEKPTLTVVNDIIQYTPDAVKIANVLLPEYAVLEDAAGAGVVDSMTLLKNGIMLVQQKYATAPKGQATNDAKKAEVMTTFAPAVITMLGAAGVKNATTTRVGNMVDAIVQMLNSNVVPTSVLSAAKPA
jgi:hypothetical protein